MSSLSTLAKTSDRAFPFAAELMGVLSIAALGVLGFLLFPDDLAFLTRLIGITLLVLALIAGAATWRALRTPPRTPDAAEEATATSATA